MVCIDETFVIFKGVRIQESPSAEGREETRLGASVSGYAAGDGRPGRGSCCCPGVGGGGQGKGGWDRNVVCKITATTILLI